MLRVETVDQVRGSAYRALMSKGTDDREIARHQPASKVRIELSADERKRIAAELGLGEGDMDVVPAYVDIARFDVKRATDDVDGFMFRAYATPRKQGGLIATFQPERIDARIPPWVLVAV